MVFPNGCVIDFVSQNLSGVQDLNRITSITKLISNALHKAPNTLDTELDMKSLIESSN